MRVRPIGGTWDAFQGHHGATQGPWGTRATRAHGSRCSPACACILVPTEESSLPMVRFLGEAPAPPEARGDSHDTMASRNWGHVMVSA